MKFKKPNRKFVIIAAAALVVIAMVIGISINNTQHAKNVGHALITDPGYKTVLPGGKSIKDLGGWERISPPGSDPVFAYADKIANVSVSVSEQPLPASFKSDTAGQVAQLAKQFNATKKITADAVTVYVGTSAQGPQSAIFVKNDLLILIKSQANIKDAAWTDYIKTLR